MNLKNKINKMSFELLRIVQLIGAEADKKGVNAYLVGGVVRDLVLNREIFDLDFVVEADAILFAQSLQKKIKGALVVHERFGTASIIRKWPEKLGKCPHFDNKLKIDIATARKEKYRNPAVLPDVESGNLQEDLFRRDFTINAMAVSLNAASFGELLDPYAGIKDLKKGKIRVLHKKSLVDDPTRIFRAVRFEQRLKFKISAETKKLIRSAVTKNMFGKTEKQRIRNELILMFTEKYPEKTIRRMKALHELRFIHEDIKIGRDIDRIYRSVRKTVSWYTKTDTLGSAIEIWILNFMPLLTGLTLDKVKRISIEFRFTRKESKVLLDFISNYEKIVESLSSVVAVSPGDIFDLLDKRSIETVIFCMAKTSSKKAIKRIKSFLLEYSNIVIEITGNDLKKLGVSPGSQYKTILKAVLRARLEGKVLTKKDEVNYVKNVFVSCCHPRRKAGLCRRHPERSEGSHKIL